ncbi:MAG: tetratricopeptide repeat protein, partial [Pseudomonadota bacterium]
RVDHLVEGSVRVQGERMRVAVRLIATQADQQRWSDSFDASLEEVFAIQERIARHIVSALELHLTQEEDRHLRRQPAQGNLQAWQLAMAARQQSLRWRPDAIDQAIDLLGRAIELAGDEPMLHAALGRTWLHYREAGIDLSERPLTEAQHQAERLLAIDANDPGTRQLAGWIHYSRGEVQQAVRELQRAVQVNQSDPDTLGLLSNCYLISGRVTRARPLIERLLAIDPLTPLTQCLPGWADALDGDFRAALPAYRRMFEMDPGNPIGRLFYVWILASLGDTEELLQRVEEFPAPLADSLPAQIARMFARAVRGEALPSGEALPDHHEALAMSNDMFPRLLGQAYALAGNGTEAVRWLSVAVDRGFIHYPFLAESDPTLKGIAGDRDFVRLLETARERWSAFED